MRVAFLWRGQLAYANRQSTEAPLAAIARSLARRVGADVTVTHDHAATLERASCEAVYRVNWYDAASETFQEGALVLPEILNARAAGTE